MNGEFCGSRSVCLINGGDSCHDTVGVSLLNKWQITQSISGNRDRKLKSMKWVVFSPDLVDELTKRIHFGDDKSVDLYDGFYYACIDFLTGIMFLENTERNTQYKSKHDKATKKMASLLKHEKTHNGLNDLYSVWQGTKMMSTIYKFMLVLCHIEYRSVVTKLPQGQLPDLGQFPKKTMPLSAIPKNNSP